ncbi:Abi family protein [Segatella bryantii]|uniref:Abi family protein n=1 Tax=Segatella bryantii TaxID=77095 RepID=UPI00242C920F|nr:Abi family protein [Segatella bryantii]
MSNQKPRTLEEQLSRLKNRGMEFHDEQLAKDYLSRISYFRLKYFWMDMIDEVSDDFKDDVYFEDIIERYEFDKSLRQILFDAIETLEVGLRTRIISTLSLSTGTGLWYLNNSLFENKGYHKDFVLDLKYEFNRSTDPFARDFIRDNNNWDEESLDGDNPDAWMIIETATFGTLSKMYKNLKAQSPLQSAIANEFGLYSSKDLSSWLEAISVLRNAVAHHSRLWYRIFAKKPVNIKGHRDKWLNQDMTDNQRKRAFGVISCLLYLVNTLNPNNTLKEEILQLFTNHPKVPVYMLGFTGDWKENPIWK